MRLFRFFLLGVVAACSAKREVPAVPVSPPPSAEIVVGAPPGPARPAADAGSSPPDAGAEHTELACHPATWPAALRELPCPEPSFAERPTGFSRDGRYLASCVSTCDPCPLSCSFESTAGGAPLHLSYFSESGLPNLGTMSEAQVEKLRNAQNKKLDDFLRDHGVFPAGTERQLHGPFPFDDVRFVVKSSNNEKTGVQTLEFGTHVTGEEPTFGYQLRLGPHPMRKAPAPPTVKTKAQREDWDSQWPMNEPAAYLDVSPDGTKLAVVAIATGSMWFEAADTFLVSTPHFVATAYSNAATARYRMQSFARAAELFGKGAALKPMDADLRYRQAASFSRAKDSRTEAALTRALELGGTAFKQRARNDVDFVWVSKELWFLKATM